MMNRLSKGVLMLALFCCAHGAPHGICWLSGSEAHAATIQLPRTGQTTCYDAAGGVVACAGTGQDGDKLKGAAWPNPRFTDNANGTVTDNLTGLAWLKNANCFGTQNWATALTTANTLVGNNTQCGLNDGSLAGDWRLPNINELKSLVDLSQNTPALTTGHPFSNVQNSFYFTSSTTTTSDNAAWSLDMDGGRFLHTNVKGNTLYYWPVRGGQ
jgi:hypothetical protein